jgi:glycosyltransferase involved in cell wall biosynthesis
MTEPLVSVAMITFNHAAYIAQAIRGVLLQKIDFPIELVIGEDCSSDGTREIVRQYEKRHPDVIRVITSDTNVGMKRNASRTRKACRGKYVAFCEGDDYWHASHKLQVQVEYMEKHPECAFVYSSYDLHDVRTGRTIPDYLNHVIRKRNWQRSNNPRVLDFLEGQRRVGYGILTCTVMVRRSVYDQVVESDRVLHESDLFIRGDTQLWAEIANAYPVHYLRESLSTYNRTEESATNSRDVRKTIRLSISDAELGLYLCDKHNLPARTRKAMQARKCYESLRLAFYCRDGELADEIRRQRKTLTWKERLLYYGAKRPVCHHVCRVAILFRNAFGFLRRE